MSLIGFQGCAGAACTANVLKYKTTAATATLNATGGFILEVLLHTAVNHP